MQVTCNDRDCLCFRTVLTLRCLKGSIQRKMRSALGSKRVQAFSLLALFLSVLALVHLESLHQALHADSGSSDHHCAVTLLQAGQVESTLGEALPVLVSQTARVALVAKTGFVVAIDFLLPPSCGPPAPLS